MVQMYTIAGRQIGSHYVRRPYPEAPESWSALAMGVLATLTAGIMSFTGGSKVQKAQGPPINASSGDEEKFIKDFLAKADSDGKKGGNNVSMDKGDAGR
ncbi:hypothetical protein GLAREA_09393 [Glarea lozoyensis ATCC 20868]|uniref:Uncharacterized protein n=2 Tax=Glarea lozoyensis TaxID=101852 RepID=S3DPB2_GLAL2|nr:uncharacterized protein GLAREA_09393 [Glarea lozoyensis ATCC 20868]EHK99693.1 hypothetical protein M7I_4369 [Glarea lozoyensis 74030]EPE28273.1 hypothetical protein GLAREA_09393 [Glarea lozoyensis ATCC 20868]